MVLERIGQVLSGKVLNGLGAYESELVELAMAIECPDSTSVPRLFETVKEARNMAVHEGAWARHLSSRLVDLFLLLEQAIMEKMKCAEDIMVREPVVAETWHLVAHVRQSMLANSFSSVPVLLNQHWNIITDLMIVRFLHEAPDRKERNTRLSTTLGAAIQNGGIIPLEARCLPRDTKLASLGAAMDQGLVLITDGAPGAPRLVGILSPFDLL